MRPSLLLSVFFSLACVPAWAQSTDELIAQLKSESSHKREAAALALTEKGPEAKAAIPALLEAFKIKLELPEAEDEYDQADNDKVEEAHNDAKIQVVQALAAIGREAHVALPVLRAAYKGEARRIRWAIAQFYAALGPEVEGVIPALVEALGDDRHGENVARLLGKIRAAAPALAEALKSEDAAVRQMAAKALGQLGKAAAGAVPALAALLADKENLVRREAADALGALGIVAKAAAPKLVEAIKDEDDSMANSAMRALGGMGRAGEEALPAICEALKSESWYSRRCAAEVLGAMGPAAVDATAALVAATRDDDYGVRKAAVVALGRGPATGEAVGALVKALEDRKAIREAAAEGLVRFGAAGVPHLVKALEAGEGRVAVCEVLGKLGAEAKTAAPRLLNLFEEKANDVGLRKAAANALEKISPPPASAAPIFAAGLKSEEEGIRLAAVGVLETMGPAAAAATPELIVALEDPHWLVPTVAMRALGNIGPAAKAGIPAVAKVVKTSDNAEKRYDAAVILGRIGAPALPTLLSLLKEDDARVRANAAAGIAAMKSGAGEAVPALLEALKDEKAEVRAHAARALGTAAAENGDALPALTGALADESAKVRRCAIRALGALGAAAKPAFPALQKALKEGKGRDPQAAAPAIAAIDVEAAKAASDVMVPALMETISNPNAWKDDRQAALDALRVLGSPGLAPLAKLLEADRESTRQMVIAALLAYGDAAKSVVPALSRTLKEDESVLVRRDAAAALGQIGEGAAAPSLIEALGDESDEVHAAAITALGALKTKEAYAALLPFLDAEDTRLKRRAIDAIGGGAPPEAVPLLVRALEEERWEMRAAAAAALRRIGATVEDLPALKAAEKDPVEAVREAATGAR